MSKKKTTRFVVCVANGGDDAALEVRKIYESVPDTEAGTANLLRVIDESGEDYLYPADYFLPIDLPHNIRAALRRAS